MRAFSQPQAPAPSMVWGGRQIDTCEKQVLIWGSFQEGALISYLATTLLSDWDLNMLMPNWTFVP